MTLLLEPSIVRAGGKPPPDKLYSDTPQEADAETDQEAEDDGEKTET